MSEHEIMFGTLTPDGVMNVRMIKQSDIGRCPHYILIASHYREDGSCKCDDADERAMMIREWEYTEDSFNGIPLRGKGDGTRGEERDGGADS